MVGLLILVLLASACSAAAPEAPAMVEVVEEKHEVVAVEGAAMPTGAAMAEAEAPAEDAAVSGQVQPAVPQQQTRMIIKDGTMRLLVDDTDVAIARLTQITGDVGGYIISQQVWYDNSYADSYKYASMTIGVPSDRFEDALGRLREIAIRVLDEQASGQDVTDEFVDLESRLTNLEATRDRIRSFLEEATTVEEALKINEQLSEVEDQIEQIQGRMNYLKNRAAFSTIAISLEPLIPTPTPEPTRTPSPTLTPTPWEPGKIFQDATNSMGMTARSLTNVLIWLLVYLPLCLIPLAIIVGIWWAFLRPKQKKSKTTPPAAAPPAPPPDQGAANTN
jgi:hypothetical protein